jgi:hypothetical protein
MGEYQRFFLKDGISDLVAVDGRKATALFLLQKRDLKLMSGEQKNYLVFMQ